MTKLLDGNLFYVLLNLEICVAMIGGGGGSNKYNLNTPPT